MNLDMNSEQKWRTSMLQMAGLVAVAILIPIGTYTLFKGRLILGIVDICAGIFFIATLIGLCRGTGYKALSHTAVYSTVVLFLYLFISGGYEGTGHLWLYTFPLIAFMLLGRSAGGIAIMVLFLLSFVYAVFFSPLPGCAAYSRSFSIRFFLSLFTVIIYSLIFEYLREKYYKSLKQAQVSLEKQLTKLRHANNAKTEFLANMSHELRTPLNHIIGFTELTVEKKFGGLNEKQEEYLKDVLTSSHHLLDLINDILDLSKVEAGKLQMDAGDVDLPALLSGSLTMVKEKCLKHGIRLSLDTAGVPAAFRADERKLKQIMYNLLSNAVKFTPDGGEICVRAGLVSGTALKQLFPGLQDMKTVEVSYQESVQVIVEDTGIGIRSEDLDRIFNPFEQVESSTGRRYQGTGLGLSLTRRLVELHGGRIWVESEGEGKGSRFTFAIPVRGSETT